MGTAVATIANANPWNNQIRALCDSGSQINLITASTVRKLGLNSEKTSLSVSGVNSTKNHHITGKVTLQINFINSENCCKAIFYIVPWITKPLPEKRIQATEYKQFLSLSLADPKFHTTSAIEALFGIDIWIKIVQPNIKRSADNLILAQETKLGYIIVQSTDITQKKLSRRAIIAHLTSGILQDHLKRAS